MPIAQLPNPSSIVIVLNLGEGGGREGVKQGALHLIFFICRRGSPHNNLENLHKNLEIKMERGRRGAIRPDIFSYTFIAENLLAS
jgi:hypothetical protein